jgi:hypothetical protein
MTDTSPERPYLSGPFRRPTILVFAGLLAASAMFGGWAWWHARQGSQRFARALAAVDAQRFDRVQRELDALETTPGYTVQCHFLRGVLLVQQQRFFPALDEFGHSVDDPELRVRTLLHSGEALYRVQNFQAAIGLLVQEDCPLKEQRPQVGWRSFQCLLDPSTSFNEVAAAVVAFRLQGPPIRRRPAFGQGRQGVLVLSQFHVAFGQFQEDCLAIRLLRVAAQRFSVASDRCRKVLEVLLNQAHEPVRAGV